MRLLVSDVDSGVIEHARFSDLPRWLAPGDLLVVNTSGTMNAALDATTQTASRSSCTSRRDCRAASGPSKLRRPWRRSHRSPTVRRVRARRYDFRAADRRHSSRRIRWSTSLDAPPVCGWQRSIVPDGVPAYLARYGFPIRYSYVKQPWPPSMYQTVFATELGSAEMPSAGRPFTPELVTRLVSSGIQIAPVLLHTGVASLEDHEPPYEEFYRVSPETAERVNAARRGGHRIIAVGTTVVRALETVTDERGTTSAGEGWTSLVITPDRPLRIVNALITGLHEPHATHLTMLGRVVEAAGGNQRPSRTRLPGGEGARISAGTSSATRT